MELEEFGAIRIVVSMSLISTWTYLAVCPRTMPCFLLYLGWLTMFTLLLVGKSVGVLIGSSMGRSVNVLVVEFVV